MPDRAPDDVRLGQRRVEHARAAVRLLEAVRHLEHAALARHRRELGLVAGVGDVLAEHDDVRRARHLVVQRAVDRRHHRVGLAVGLRLGGECVACRIHVRREHPEPGRVARRASAPPAPGRSPPATRDRSTRRSSLSSASVAMPSPMQQARHPEQRDRGRPPARVPRASCTAAHRPRASASTGRVTVRADEHGPAPARTCCTAAPITP